MGKVGLYIDEEGWGRFKEMVLRKHGTLRRLSMEVGRLIRAALIEEEIVNTFKEVGIDLRLPTSPSEVEVDRPPLRGPPSQELIREKRGRCREALS